MAVIWNSILFKNLFDKGQAPEVPVSFEDKSIIYIAAAFLIVAIIAILIAYLFFHKT